MAVLMTASGPIGAQAAGQTASVATSHTTALGLYYSRGDYGESQGTRIRYVPLSHEISRGSWRVKATVPVLEITGPANVLINVGSIGGFSDSRVSANGVGDASFNLTYEMPVWSASAPFVDISAEIKVPTADPQQGLGTGRMDASMQMDLYQVAGPLTVFASAGYRYRRQSPFYPGLENSVFGSLGASASWGDRLQYGLIYDYRQPASTFTGETHEVLPYVSWTVSPAWSVMLYTVTGFTDDSADFAAGLQLSRHW